MPNLGRARVFKRSFDRGRADRLPPHECDAVFAAGRGHAALGSVRVAPPTRPGDTEASGLKQTSHRRERTVVNGAGPLPAPSGMTGQLPPGCTSLQDAPPWDASRRSGWTCYPGPGFPTRPSSQVVWSTPTRRLHYAGRGMIGKNHWATTLAYEACLTGHGVLFTPDIDIVNDRGERQPPRRDNASDLRPPERVAEACDSRTAKRGGCSL